MMREEIDIMQEKHYVETPKFTGRNVPVDEIAKATHLRKMELRIIHFTVQINKFGKN